MTIREFFAVRNRTSIPPHFADLMAAATVLVLGAILPLCLAPLRSPSTVLGVGLGATAAAVFASLIPSRIIVTEHGLGVVCLFGRNQALMEPGRKRWWGRHLLWEEMASITRMKVNQRRVGSDWRFFPDLGQYRYVVRVRWGRSYELYDSSPAFALFERAAQTRSREDGRRQ